nr:AraC family transcriptional regulator [Thiomicrorhabdus sp. 6S3-12]
MIEYIGASYHGESNIQTAFEPLSFFVNDKPTEMLSILYEPSLCVIVQGEKEVGINNELIRYTPDMYLLASVHTPAQVRITDASPERPYMGFTITFTMEQILEVLKDMEPLEEEPVEAHGGLYFGQMEGKLLDSVLRLINTLDSPEEVRVLAPGHIREILYFLLKAEGGKFIRQYMKAGNSAQKVVQAISLIKDRFTQNLNVKELAENVGMSESSLYSMFKKMTTMSPLQFQKTLRLQTAKRLLTLHNLPVNETAFKVGYESPSQFSREYSRMYGLSPKADAMQVAPKQSVN